MKLRILIYLLSTLCLLSACKNNKGQATTSKETTLATIDTLTIPKSTQGLKPALRLTTKAQEAVKDWSLYQNLTKRLDSLQEVSLGTVKNQLTALITIFDGLQEAEEATLDLTPDNLESPAIKARLLSVETNLKILNNQVQKNDPNPEEIATAVVSLKNAFQNLNLQVNEKFALTIEEMLKKFDQEANDLQDTPEVKKPTPTGKPPIKIIKPIQ